MSSDYIEALKLGSNMIRIGTTIFGSRMLDRKVLLLAEEIWKTIAEGLLDDNINNSKLINIVDSDKN